MMPAMTKEDFLLINNGFNAPNNTTPSSYAENRLLALLSSFTSAYDKEIVALIIAWLSNGYEQEEDVAERLICGTMQSKPYEYILSYEHKEDDWKEQRSFFGNLTYKNLDNLLVRTQEIVHAYGNIRMAYDARKKDNLRRFKFAHDVFSDLFDCGTGFQSTSNVSAYYRANLFFYLVTYKTRTWEINTKRMLLPCNDKVIRVARNLGIFRTSNAPTLTNAIKLTNIAKSWLGDDFYKMYEILNSYNEDVARKQ